jgi:hypothetical protein
MLFRKEHAGRRVNSHVGADDAAHRHPQPPLGFAVVKQQPPGYDQDDD